MSNEERKDEFFELTHAKAQRCQGRKEQEKIFINFAFFESLVS